MLIFVQCIQRHRHIISPLLSVPNQRWSLIWTAPISRRWPVSMIYPIDMNRKALLASSNRWSINVHSINWPIKQPSNTEKTRGCDFAMENNPNPHHHSTRSLNPSFSSSPSPISAGVTSSVMYRSRRQPMSHGQLNGPPPVAPRRHSSISNNKYLSSHRSSRTTSTSSSIVPMTDLIPSDDEQQQQQQPLPQNNDDTSILDVKRLEMFYSSVGTMVKSARSIARLYTTSTRQVSGLEDLVMPTARCGPFGSTIQWVSEFVFDLPDRIAISLCLDSLRVPTWNVHAKFDYYSLNTTVASLFGQLWSRIKLKYVYRKIITLPVGFRNRIYWWYWNLNVKMLVDYSIVTTTKS